MNTACKIKKLILSNIVLVIAFILAIITMFFVPPDAKYLGYFDLETLSTLFLMMLIIAGLKNMRVFVFLASELIKDLKNTRRLVFALVFITFIASMILANDMALLTFLPLTLTVFKSANKEEYIPFTVIMQNIAANLGGMILPFGNPQSLYLFNYFSLTSETFVTIMFVPFIISVVMIIFTCFFAKSEQVGHETIVENKISIKKLTVYLVCFLAVLLCVFGLFPFEIVSFAIVLIMLFMDRNAFFKVDYSLLLTFVCFFIFASNMSRIESVTNFVSGLTEKNTLLTGVISCQFFSNVPTAIFLSKFTQNVKQLLLAVNIGGTGSLIASLASLISFRIFSKEYPNKSKKYLLSFTLINYTFLIILTFVCWFI